MRKASVGCCICCHDDDYALKSAIQAVITATSVIVYISRLAWDSSVGKWERCAEVAKAAGAEVVVGNWPTESLHRRFAIADMAKRGFSHALVLDSDEILEPRLLEALMGIAESGTAERVHVHMETYWKSPEYVIRPREALTPIVLIDLHSVEHVHIREYSGGRRLILGPDYGFLHHLSYCGSSERILRKIHTWSHKHEIVPNWYAEKYIAWDDNRLLRDLHPTHPHAYHQTERIPVPEILASIPVEEREEILPGSPWPKISVVIPLYGGADDIRLCLESLELHRDLIHEIIVVDDASPDRAPDVARGFEGVTLICNASNVGFAATCNIGFRASTGEVVVFLNSDTVVPRSGLIRLIESLMSSKFIAAAGPYSNNTGHHQQIASTYESLMTMPLFADDFARMELSDTDVDMLVGFCLAVKREVLDEIGLFDERFGTGMFEDNDLCYRARRAGYRLVLARRAFVHHSGSRSLARRKEHPASLMARNNRIYLDKWKDDLECGFVNHLAGTSASPMVFDASRKPEEIDRRIKRLAKKAGITLCMIVKNEERVLRACLESTRGAFVKTVIVDTGSTDRTMEIAREFGAELHEIPWPDSYSEARNVSLSYADSPWTFWMDADDTLDRNSLEVILQAAIHAQNKKVGFVIPVRFVDEGPYGGTQVDHLKMWPTLTGVAFEGHVHEQILGSLRARGVEPVRLKGTVVHHSGYDTSPEGQARKREREMRLLKKDHEEDPTHPFRLFNLGMTLHYLKEHEEAVDWLERSLKASGPKESIVRKTYSLLGVSRRELGDLAGALDTFERGLEVCPEDPELLFQSAVVLATLGQLEEAKKCYLRVKLDMPDELSSMDVGILTFKRFHNLGTVCLALGNYSEAKEWWKQAISTAPTFSPSAMEMFEAAITHFDIAGAKGALDALLAAEGPTEGWAGRLCRLSEVTGQSPEQNLRLFLQASPYAIGPLMVLARLLIARGDHAGAAPLLEELDRLGSAEAAFHRGLLALSDMDFWQALSHMSRAHELNPLHGDTENHRRELQRVLSLELPAPLEVIGKEVLKGPHIGELGAGTISYSIVIVTYNSAGTIDECVGRLLSTVGQEDEVLIVDNASTDGTRYLLETLAGEDSRIRLILNDQNIGYSKAANLGMLASRGEEIVLLNPDAYVDECWLESLSSCLSDEVAVVGPMSDNVGGDQFVGHILRGRHPAVEELSGLLKTEFLGKREETKFLVGICLMMRREMLDRHGLLDEGTELGADDLEFSWRLRNLGYKLAIAMDVFVRHVQGVSFSSLPPPERVRRQAFSDFALMRKLQAFYGAGNVPGSMEIWGTPIFDEAFERLRLLE